MAAASKPAINKRSRGISRSRDTRPKVTTSAAPAEATAKVFMSGRSQAVRIPVEFRFKQKEVMIRRDEQSGDVILSEPKKKRRWAEIFAVLDAANIPADFMDDRDQGFLPVREEL